MEEGDPLEDGDPLEEDDPLDDGDSGRLSESLEYDVDGALRIAPLGVRLAPGDE